MPTGREFYETDTGVLFVVDSAGSWVAKRDNAAAVTIAAIIAPVTVAGGESSADSTVLDYHKKCPQTLAFTVAGTYATTSSTTGLVLQIFYSPDGTNYDTDAYTTIEPAVTASAATPQTVQRTRPVTPVPGYYKCKVVNMDAVVSATTVKVTALEVM